MRTRVTGPQVIEPGFTVKDYETFNSQTQKWEDAGTTKEPFISSCPAGKLATIVDIAPHKGRRPPYLQVNPVDHVVVDYPRISSERFGWVYESSTRRYMHGYAGFSNQAGHPSFAPKRPNWWQTTLPHKEAADFFNSGGVGTEVLLPNFLIELPSIKSTFSFVKQGLKKGRDVVDKTALIGSGGFLSYNYGIAPLIADLKAIGGYVESLQKRLEWLLANDGKVVSLDFRKSLYKPSATVSVTASHYWNVVEYSQSYHAFCRWTVRYDPVRSAWEKLKYFNRYFGTTRLLSVAWEALPYSFLIDYVTNIGSLLTQLELPTSLDPSCEGVGWSQKETMVLDLKYRPPGGLPHTRIGKVSYKRYIRRPGLPLSLTTAVNLDSPTGKQQALFYALIHQKR